MTEAEAEEVPTGDAEAPAAASELEEGELENFSNEDEQLLNEVIGTPPPDDAKDEEQTAADAADAVKAGEPVAEEAGAGPVASAWRLAAPRGVAKNISIFKRPSQANLNYPVIKPTAVLTVAAPGA